MADTFVVELEIREGGDDTRRLVHCVVRRLTGDPEATPPNTEPGILPISVQADPDADPDTVRALAEQAINECAAELNIAEPSHLLSIHRIARPS